MDRKKKWIAAGLLAGAALVGGVGTGVAQQTAPEDDQPLTGDAYDKATARALEVNPGGTVSETELGDTGTTYEVEVVLPEGHQVEVNLDQNYQVTGQEIDDDADDDADDANEVDDADEPDDADDPNEVEDDD